MEDFRINKKIEYILFLFSKKLETSFKENDIDLTAEQYSLLSKLWKCNGCIQQHLADACKRDRSAVTRMIDILENKNMVIRIPDKNDRRVKTVYLTKKGENMEAKANECLRKATDILFDGFSKDEITLLNNYFQRISENLKV